MTTIAYQKVKSQRNFRQSSHRFIDCLPSLFLVLSGLIGKQGAGSHKTGMNRNGTESNGRVGIAARLSASVLESLR